MVICCFMVCLFFLLQAPLLAADSKVDKPFKDPRPELHAELNQAENLANKGRFKEAQARLSAYAAAHPAERHPLLFYEQGYFAYKANNLDAALESLQKCTDIAPDYQDGWQLLSLVWREKGDSYSVEIKEEKPKRIRAMQYSAIAMDRAAQIAGDDDLLYQTAMLWLEAEKAKKALSILEPLSKKARPKQEWLVGLSEVLKALKKTEETAEAMEKAARVNNDPGLLFHAAWLWSELEKPKRSLPLLLILSERNEPDKNWLLLLASVYNTLARYGDAALVFERIIEIDPAPDYLYNCGILWLQVEKADRALKSLQRLTNVEPPKAEWFVAQAQAWLMKKDIENAADAMERAASISKKPEHIYQAGSLRLQLKQADRAIKLLTPLAKLSKPKSQWLIALSNAWLLKENYLKGATYMEQAAYISGLGRHFHQAGMLWRLENKIDKTITLLKKSINSKDPQQLWFIDLASVLLDVNRDAEVRSVMKRTNLSEKTVSNQLRYRGVVIWLNLEMPEKAYPLLQILNRDENPSYAWMSSLVKTCVELGKMKEAQEVMNKTLTRYPDQIRSWKLAVWLALQSENYVAAAAAKEVVRQFEPNNSKHKEDLSRMYLLAGVPQQAAKYYTKTIDGEPSSEQLDHLLNIYLSGRRNREALSVAEKLVKKEKTSKRLESLGDIYYAMHRYAESCDAYEEAVESSTEAGHALLMKAAYSAMKKRQYARAAKYFTQAAASESADEKTLQLAMQNLAYIERMQDSGYISKKKE